MGILGGGGSAQFTHGILIAAMVIAIMLPSMLTIATSLNDTGIDDTTEKVLGNYYQFTGSRPVKEAVWALEGIYRPYQGGSSYGYTDDGWLYGSRVDSYRPSQYQGTNYAYTVNRSNGLYYYGTDTINGDHESGELYTSVAMDPTEKSDRFFTQNGKTQQDKWFYYDYTGYRYSFKPLANYNGVDADGKPIDVTSTDTSLSLIWYDYYGSQGISGQLILSGSDSGVAYLTADEIVSRFSTTTSTSKFDMFFNGVQMNVYIRLNPVYLAQTGDIEACWNQGYWEIMVTSLSTDVDAYMNTDFSFNPMDIFMTMVKLLTFDTADFGISGWLAVVLSIAYAVPLYAALIALAMENEIVLILAGILAAIQGAGLLGLIF